MSSPQAFAQIGKAIRASSSEPKVGIQFIQADGFHHSYRAQIVTSQLMVKFPEFSKITAPRYTHQPWISVVFPLFFWGSGPPNPSPPSPWVKLSVLGTQVVPVASGGDASQQPWVGHLLGLVWLGLPPEAGALDPLDRQIGWAVRLGRSGKLINWKHRNWKPGLVNGYTRNWKDPPWRFSWENQWTSTISTGPCSIAMLNYQRVSATAVNGIGHGVFLCDDHLLVGFN